MNFILSCVELKVRENYLTVLSAGLDPFIAGVQTVDHSITPCTRSHTDSRLTAIPIMFRARCNADTVSKVDLCVRVL